MPSRNFDGMRVKPLKYEDLDDEELKGLFKTFYRNRDTDTPTLPNHYKVEAHFPVALKHILLAIEHVKATGDLSYELAQKISIAVSMANGCEYCTGVYCSILSDELGSQDIVREFQQAFQSNNLSGKERDIIEFAVRMNDEPNQLTDDDFDNLRERYQLTDQDFVQILFIVNIVNGYNRVTNAFDCELEEVYHAGPWEPVT